MKLSLSLLAALCLGGIHERPIRKRKLFLHANNDRDDVVDLNRGIVKLGTGELRQMDQLISKLRDLSADFLTRLHPQLNGPSHIPFENVVDRIARLQIDFVPTPVLPNPRWIGRSAGDVKIIAAIGRH